MVARVDRALKDDLGIAVGLAADNVYVLDPCCGTGAYLAEVLRRIAENLRGPGPGRPHRREGQAGRDRAGLRLRDHAGPVRHRPSAGRPHHAGARRTACRRRQTNAPASSSPTPSPAGSRRVQKPLLIAELEEERERAGQVKQDTPILVIIGNPRLTTASPAWLSTRNASCRKPIARPRGSAGPPKARDSTTFTSASSEWPSAASPRRPARASSASSPTTHG